MRDNIGLYKAKRKDNGEWIEGNLVIAGNCAYILPDVADFAYGDNGNRCRIGCWVEVDPETVCEFTGQTDENNRKIFEGDIVKDSYRIMLVEWNEYLAMFEFVHNHKYGTDRLILCDGSFYFEILGNIFDNPELLEVEK